MKKKRPKHVKPLICFRSFWIKIWKNFINANFDKCNFKANIFMFDFIKVKTRLCAFTLKKITEKVQKRTKKHDI